MIKRAIILANGQYPRKSDFNYFEKAGFRTLICADGGANSAYKLKLQPDYIIGDLDSVFDKVLEYYKKSASVIRVPSQYSTDVEKCLKFAIRKGYTETILTGATGDRLDHTFCNLGIVLKFFDKIRIHILHQKTILSAYQGDVGLNTSPGEIISIYGFDNKTRISSKGLKYPLKNAALPFGVKESTSNEALGDEVILRIERGRVFVIRKFAALKKNGFFFLN